MSNENLFNVPEIIRTTNVPSNFTPDKCRYFPAACLGFAVLILTTVIGNTLVLSALFLDKKLHTPSFFLIANMAIADLLLGISVLPFSSILELLNDRWIFGQTFCSTWLALDVLCCTASIIGLMAVSIDRYLGVTRPLTYSSIMTIRRTIYLIIIVWAVSILTSVVPLFGLTDQGKKTIDTDANPYICKVNKNTLYTIFSSMISFYIPVIILLILYSRVYQEAKKQGEKLENEKRRLYQIDYQIIAEQARQQQNHSNGHTTNDTRHSNLLDETKDDVSPLPLIPPSVNNLDEENNLDRTSMSTDAVQLNKDYTDSKNKNDDDTSHSGSSTAHKKHHTCRLISKRLYSTIKRNSLSHSTLFHHSVPQTDELIAIKHKLQNLKHEKKAFRTVGLILGALLICWLPFFVTLPVISILKHLGHIKDENMENTWFKITFWLGYCNSALNPFVYAFSNRSIRRAFRQQIFRRCCCCLCPKSANVERQNSRLTHAYSGSLIVDTSQLASKRNYSCSNNIDRTISKADGELDTSADSPFRGPSTGGPVVSFADFLADTGDDDEEDQQPNSEVPLKSTKRDVTPI